MRLYDMAQFNLKALMAYPVRTALILLAIAIGVTAVVLLTSLGESARRYVSNQFTSLGTNLLIVIPGKTETAGGIPGLTGQTPRDLTIDDAVALSRHPLIAHAAPVVMGNAPVSFGALEREVTLIGSTPALLSVLNLSLATGKIWQDDDPHVNSPVCLIGQELKQELFGAQNALGAKVRIGDARFRVLGVLKDKGQTIGMDFNDMLIIPVANGQAVLNSPSLVRIMVSARRQSDMNAANTALKRILKARHNDEEDITVVTQDAMLSTFDDILKVLTYAIAAIGSISLLVAGILTMNVMLVSVNQRKAEIGLLKALGASTARVTRLFIGEALLLSIAGVICGALLSLSLITLLAIFLPQFPIETPLWAWFAVTLMTLATGLIFGTIPARQAARLDPVQALSS